MINVHIYLDSKKNAKELVYGLMSAELVAHASIDKDNNYFIREDGKEIVEGFNYLITAQTKALLFSEIVAFIDNNYKGSVKIYSVPITQCNEIFGEIIRLNTKKI